MKNEQIRQALSMCNEMQEAQQETLAAFAVFRDEVKAQNKRFNDAQAKLSMLLATALSNEN